MLDQAPFPLRVECPPGACTCRREELYAAPEPDLRPLRLTREEEKKLIARIEAITTWAEMQRLAGKMREQLGIELNIIPSVRGVRTVFGLTISLTERPGLCRKVRESIPRAVRRCLDTHPDIIYALLDERGLFAGPDLAS